MTRNRSATARLSWSSSATSGPKRLVEAVDQLLAVGQHELDDLQRPLCFGNVVAEKDAAENEKFAKDKARGRIDGAVAAAMAVGRILSNEVTPSPYESREAGFLFV